MRHERQPWKSIVVRTQIGHPFTNNALPYQTRTGRNVTCKVKRLSDSMWYNQATNQFDSASPVANAMSEPDATNLPGFYTLPVLDTQSPSTSQGFAAYIEETAFGWEEYVFIRPVDLGMDALVSEHLGAGTLGDTVARTAALRQQNMRVVYSAHTAGGSPTDGTIYVYPDRATMLADTGGTGVGAFGSYEFDATFDGVKPLTYTSGKLT